MQFNVLSLAGCFFSSFTCKCIKYYGRLSAVNGSLLLFFKVKKKKKMIVAKDSSDVL